MTRRITGRATPGEGGGIEHFETGTPTPSGSGGEGSNRILSGATRTAADIQSGATILDSTIPVVYGPAKVNGVMSWRHKNAGNYFLGFVFCMGEVDDISEVYFGNRKIWPVVTASGYIPLVRWEQLHLGDGSFAPIEPYASLMNATDISAHKDKACIFFTIADSKSLPGGTFSISALTTGIKIAPVGGGAPTNSVNVADVAYHIQTAEMWKGVPAGEVDAAETWDEFGGYSSEAMSDATARYTFQGVIAERNPDAAIEAVLAHGFAHRYHNAAGQVCLWHEGPPAASTGAWSAVASATITEDSTAGAATTEFEEGDWILAGTSKAQIVTITDDDTIILDRLVTITAASLRKLAGVYIKKEDWAGTGPSALEVSLSTIPDEVIVRYTLDDKFGGAQYPLAVDVTGDKRVEMSAVGCKSASQARRLSETSLDIRTLQKFSWKGDVTGIGAAIVPGMIVLFDDDVLTEQLAKVTAIRWNYKKGTYTLDLQEFDPLAHSEGIATDDTPPAYDEADPDAPTALTQTFGEAGDWDAFTIIPNPDDLSSWAWDAGLAAAYDGVDDETELTLTNGAVGWKRGKAQIAVDGQNVLFTSQMLRWISGADENTEVNLEYWSGADAGSATRQKAIRLTPYDNDSNSLWERTFHRFPLSSDAYHELRVAVRNTDPSAMSADSVVGIKRLRGVVWGKQGEPVETIYHDDPSHVTSKLSLYTRYEWTEHGSAGSTVDTYQLRRADIETVIDSIAVGGDAIFWQTTDSLQDYNGNHWLGTGGNADKYRGPYMLAVGPTAKAEEFPPPTQAFEGSSAPPATDWIRNSYSAIFDEELQVYGDFTTWGPWPDTQLSEGVWDDYLMELWIDRTGGSNYVKEIEAEWGDNPNGIIGMGYNPMNFAIDLVAFVHLTKAQNVVANYQIWLTNKYTGRSTQMSEVQVTSTSGSTYAPPTPTIAISDPFLEFTFTATDGAGGQVITFISTMSWTNGSATNEAIEYFAFETQEAASPGATRSEWKLFSSDAVRASWSDDTQATFAEDFAWPGSHDQMRVIAVGIYGNEAASGWANITTDSDSSSAVGSIDDLDDVDTTLVNTGDILVFDGADWVDTDPDGIDGTAIHDNVAGEINALTTVTAAAGDLVLIEDASDSWNKKEVTAQTIADLGPNIGPVRVDEDNDGSYRRYINILSDHSNGTSGAVVIRPFGNATATTELVAFNFTIKINHGNTGGKAAWEIMIAGFWNGSTPAWDSTRNRIETIAGEGASGVMSDHVRLCRDNNGYPAILIGDTGDVSAATAIAVDVALNRGDASNFDPGVVTYGRVTSLTSWTTDVDANPSSEVRDGIIVSNDSGSSMSKGDLCYISGDSSGVPQVELADADAASTATKMLVVIAETIATGSDGLAITRGVLSGLSGFTAAAIQYVHTTAGDFTQTAPSSTGDIVRVAGYAISTTEIFFDPGKSWVEIV